MKRHKTLPNLMKSLAFLLVVSLLFLPYNLAYAEDTTIISISVPSQVSPGEQFTVDIFVQPHIAIAGVQFDLSFDSSIATVDSITEGQLLSQGGATTYFNPGIIDNVAGSVSGVVGVIIAPGQTVSTEEVFATMTLTAGAGSGTCAFTLSDVVVGDINGQSVATSVVNGQVIVNQAPVLSTIGDNSVNEGETITFSITATDVDSGNLTYSASNLPSGATFNPSTKTFSWTPRYDQAGTYENIHFEVSDGYSNDSENITVTVIQLYADWDVNGDTDVNTLDMILIGQHWNEVGLTGWIKEDVNEDGKINVLDMILVGQNWTE